MLNIPLKQRSQNSIHYSLRRDPGEYHYGNYPVATGLTPNKTCKPCLDPHCSSCLDNYAVCTRCHDSLDHPYPVRQPYGFAGKRSCLPCSPGCRDCLEDYTKCNACFFLGYEMAPDATCKACRTSNCRWCRYDTTAGHCTSLHHTDSFLIAPFTPPQPSYYCDEKGKH